MSGWDWIHAGLEAAAYNEARKAQQNLGAMRTTAEAQIARQTLLEAMRAFIFDISRDVKLASEQMDAHPFQVYIIVQALGQRLINSRLDPEMFPDFQDKEYVFQTQKITKETIEQSKSAISVEQVQQGDVAAKYIVEMPLLKSAILAKEGVEFRTATKQEWDMLEKENNRKKTFNILGIIGLVMFLCVGTSLFFGSFAMIASGDFGTVVGGMVMLAISGGWLAGSIALIAKGGKANPKLRQLKNDRENWKQHLMSREDWNEVTQKNGDLSSKEYQKIYDERLAFLNLLLDGDFQSVLSG